MTAKLRKFYETGSRVNDEPLVCVFENFLSDGEVEHLLAAAAPKLEQALVSGPISAELHAGRSGSSSWVPHRYDAVIEELSLRIAEVVGIGLEYAEPLLVIYYAKGEECAPHYDAWDKTSERGKNCMAKGGQRMVTCLFYLSDVEEGGGTAFPNLDMEIRAKKGRLVLFHNCQEGSTVPHPDSLHAGLPILKGEKWACNFWFRELLYQAPETVPTEPVDSTVQPKYSRII